MARINMNEAAEFASKGGDFNFFSLKDREVKRVRILATSMDDIDIYSVHQVKGNDNKTRNVSCLRAMNEPIQKCPFCNANFKPRARAYVWLLDEKGVLFVWERSYSFLQELQGYMQRYGDLTQYLFDIERRGAAGDTNTKYMLYPIGPSPVNAEDLPEKPNVLGRLVLEKDANEMNNFIQLGTFPENIKPDANQQLNLQRREYVKPDLEEQGDTQVFYANNQNGPRQSQPSENSWGQQPRNTNTNRGGW